MAHIYREKREIPIPDGAHINRHDGRVFVFLREGNVLAKSRRVVIGRAASTSTMYPNDSFKRMYPALWKEHYGENEVIKEHQLHSGMYAACLGVGYKSGIYEVLVDSLGSQAANAVMDLSMYSILKMDDADMTFGEKMKYEVMFSNKLPDSSWICHARENFCDKWIQLCKEHGETKAWISIDSSPVIYAVGAETGMPLAYRVRSTDNKAILDLALYLQRFGVETEGLILDRSLCSSSVFASLEELKYPYLVMLKNDTFSHLQAYGESSSKIRMNVACIINSDAVFGMCQDGKRKIFKDADSEAYINLFYDGKNEQTLIREVLTTADLIREKVAEGEVPEIPDKLSKYIEIAGSEVRLKKKELQDSVEMAGFHSIASDKNYGADYVYRHFHLKDALKMGLESENPTEIDENNLLVRFVSSVLMSEMMQAAKAVDVPIDQMICEIDGMNLFLTHSGVYEAVHDESELQKKFLKILNVLPEDFDSIASDVNARMSPNSSQYRVLSRIEQEKKEARSPQNRKSKNNPKSPVN